MEIALVLSILLIALILFVTEWVRVDVVALLVLVSLAVTGLVTAPEALAGFSNPAVVTVWAIFIISSALARTGVANTIGKHILRLAGDGEGRTVAAIMLTAGMMSAFMNNIGVAALLLPVVMDIARRTRRPPSRLLMPLAYGALLGGLTTLVGTPPNILVSDALRKQGLQPFELFDYTPVGGMAMLAGILFITLLGRRMLPTRDLVRESTAGGVADLARQYELAERLLVMRVGEESALAGRTLSGSRLGSVMGLNVVAIIRDGKTILAPGAGQRIANGDRLIVQGRPRAMDRLTAWQQLAVEETDFDISELVSTEIAAAEARISKSSSLIGETLLETGFRRHYGVTVLAISRGGKARRTGLQSTALRAGDFLLLQGSKERLEELSEKADFDQFRYASRSELSDRYHLGERIFQVRLPEGSLLAGRTLEASKLGEGLGFSVLGIVRDGSIKLMPEPSEQLLEGDRLVIEGKTTNLQVLRGLMELVTESDASREFARLVSDRIGLVEAMLSHRSQLARKTIREIRFRERYGISVLAVWREGEVISTDLQEVELRMGDALLLHGPREKLELLGQDPDFLVLTESAQTPPRTEKAPIAILIAALALIPVLLGLVPIPIAAVAGAAFMVVTGCLRMEEAYRDIEWRAVFLIAGMLPLGTAMSNTGAATLMAEGVIGLVGHLGPAAILAALVVMTSIAVMVIPPAALVVLMAPIVLTTATDLGLSPHALMMAVGMSASASFMSPVSHPANTLIMGPGGYRFIDFLKVGVPLTLVVLGTILVVLPLIWPLRVQ